MSGYYLVTVPDYLEYGTYLCEKCECSGRSKEEQPRCWNCDAFAKVLVKPYKKKQEA